MKNQDKYGSNLKAAIAAYNDEMAKRAENGIDGLPFEDWADNEEDSTARLLEDKRKAEEAAAKVVEDEKEYIRKAIPELAAHFKANGWDEADNLLGELNRLDPKMEVFEVVASAADCFHSGMWSVVCGDFNAVWDFYLYCKATGCCHEWDNVKKWHEKTKALAKCIKPFIDEAKPLVEEIKAKGGNAK